LLLDRRSRGKLTKLAGLEVSEVELLEPDLPFEGVISATATVRDIILADDPDDGDVRLREPAGSADGLFEVTRFDLIVTATGAASSDAQKAMSELCQIYWPPVYAFVRKRGSNPDDAMDLTQGFFAKLLEGNHLARFDPERGRFRYWLLTSLKNFLADESRNARTQKRGGNAVVVSIDLHDAEDRYAHEPVDTLTPEQMYERRWAITLLERVMERLKQHYAKTNKLERFESLRGFLVDDTQSYDVLGETLGETPDALRRQVHRMRLRYRGLLRDAIVEHNGPDPNGEYLRYLLDIFS
jgi:RNA polymerase sigma factor (sigma-70 family)